MAISADACEWKAKSCMQKLCWPLLSSAVIAMMLLFLISFVMSLSTVFSSALWFYGVSLVAVWFMVSFVWIYTKNRMVFDSWQQKLESLPSREPSDDLSPLELSYSGQRESMHKQAK